MIRATVMAAEPSHEGLPIVVVVAPSRVLAGVVQLADSTPIAGAEVLLTLPDGLRSTFEVSLQHSELREWKVTSDDLVNRILDRVEVP